ncbi:galactose-binding domain-like protein [Boletus edulis]|uniref:Galactose-binding domain-like protein n=1 Tax=Boletus edulis BED1 TaxID=1328754 RepID=A0AAD4BTR2_BOLED|nr:galactose-binding domain-like protein [Boletus edulis]KAF8439102.1 galactose-binding domain-like protein [Boletus edulis BED1]
MSADQPSNSVAADLNGANHSNLFGYIDRDNVHGLNLAVPEQAKQLIKPWSDREDTSQFADSGVDDQMIIHVPFSQNVRIKSVILKIGRGESTPRHLKIFANYSNIVDFADMENTKPHLDISLLEGDTGAVEYPLRIAAFTSVHALSLYFGQSVGGDLSRVYFVGFKGDSRTGRKEGTNKLEIPAANAPDAPLVDRLKQNAGGQQTTAR